MFVGEKIFSIAMNDNESQEFCGKKTNVLRLIHKAYQSCNSERI